MLFRECNICLHKKYKKRFEQCKVCKHKVCNKCIKEIRCKNNLCPFCRSEIPRKIKRIDNLTFRISVLIIIKCLPKNISNKELRKMIMRAYNRRNDSEIDFLLYKSLLEILKNRHRQQRIFVV